MISNVHVPMTIPDVQIDRGTLFSEDIRVTANGASCQVRRCRESAIPFNRVWPGYQRSIDQTELASFVSFAGDGPVEIRVTGMARTGDAPAVVRPLSRKVEPVAEGDCVTLALDAPGQYVLENGSFHQPLYIFYNPLAPETETGRTARWQFGPGLHFPGAIRVESGDSVYIAPDAIVFGGIYGENVHDVRIYGGGTLHGGTTARVFASFSENFQNSTIKFYNSTDITIEDIIVQDASGWVVSFWGCSRIDIARIKILGQWRYNTDGIDLCNSDHVLIHDSFIRSFDDNIVLKGMDFVDFKTVPWQKGRPLADITARNCVLWCGWGRTLEIGIETAAPEYRDILFEDCDLIHNSAVCLDIQNGLDADIHHLVFRNLRIEYQADTLPEIFQQSDDQPYEPRDLPGMPKLIFADNHRYIDLPFRYGSTHDILFEDIDVLLEPGVPRKLNVRIANLSDESVVRDFQLRRIRVNGIPLAGPADVLYETGGRVENISWE